MSKKVNECNGTLSLVMEVVRYISIQRCRYIYCFLLAMMLRMARQEMTHTMLAAIR